MKREHLAFLSGGFVFGILFGFAMFYAIEHRPELDAGTPQSAMGSPRGPRAPTQVGPNAAEGGAPMMARINNLKRALEQDPEDFGAAIELAEIYQSVQMWEQASVFWERVVEIRPGEPELLVNLGLSYREMGDFDRALEAFDRAHAEDPAHWQALFNKAIVAARDAGRLEMAWEALERMESIEPRPADLNPSDVQRLRDWLSQARAEGGEEQS